MKPNNLSYVELHVPDFRLAEKFYGELGFERVWEHAPEGHDGYLVLRLGNNILAFWPGNQQVYNHPFFEKFPKDTPRGYGVELVIMVSEIDEIYAKAQGVANIVEELKTKPWGLRDFRIEDPFGFYVRFTEPTDILVSSENAIK